MDATIQDSTYSDELEAQRRVDKIIATYPARLGNADKQRLADEVLADNLISTFSDRWIAKMLGNRVTDRYITGRSKALNLYRPYRRAFRGYTMNIENLKGVRTPVLPLEQQIVSLLDKVVQGAPPLAIARQIIALVQEADNRQLN